MLCFFVFFINLTTYVFCASGFTPLTNQVNHYYYYLALSNEILLHQSNCCTLCGSFFVTLILGPVVQCSPGDVFTGV